MKTATLSESFDLRLAWTGEFAAEGCVPTLTAEEALRQVAAFCTRVLLCAGRAPDGEPMLPRELLAVYACGALEALCATHGLEWQPLAVRLIEDLLFAPDAVATWVRKSDSSRQAVMQLGAAAFAEWSADPREFAADDFKLLVAAKARVSLAWIEAM